MPNLLHLSAFALAASLAAIAPARAVTTTAIVSTFDFSGTCSDCTGAGTGELKLGNYNLGDAITANNFLSFVYNGTNLLPAFSITAADASGLSGSMSAPLPGAEDFSVVGNDGDFTSQANGFWCVGGACYADYGFSHSWTAVQTISTTPTGVPEPMSPRLARRRPARRRRPPLQRPTQDLTRPRPLEAPIPTCDTDLPKGVSGMSQVSTLPDPILLGRGAPPSATLQRLDLAYANRHGLVAGATGTGKTITLQVLAEQFSQAGIPVFCADVKGDLAGLAQPGAPNPKLDARAAETGRTPFTYRGCPVLFWDVFGVDGHPVRATVTEMGPVLLSRMLELNDTQEGVLSIAFRLADDEGLLLLDFKDIRAILTYVGTKAAELATTYGNVTKATIGTIQRRLLVLEQAGAESFFGEPALDLADLMRTSSNGAGAISILAADKLIRSPRLYATVLLWLLSTLYEKLPEAGDLPQPKLVFFFDEAHLLFDGAPKALVDKIEQIVRLIRSKGVGVYFVTQNPLDVPPTILGQLGNRVQHALRAFTPADQKAVRAAADTFRPNPAFDTQTAITELAVGEALVSLLGPGGVPGIVDRTAICPPASRIGTITADERRAILAASPVAGRYDTPIDRESAYERLNGRAAQSAAPVPTPSSVDTSNPWGVQPAPIAAPIAAPQPGGNVWNQGAYVPAPQAQPYIPRHPNPPRTAKAPSAKSSNTSCSATAAAKAWPKRWPNPSSAASVPASAAPCSAASSARLPARVDRACRSTKMHRLLFRL